MITKIFEYNWDAGGYGRGVLLIAAIDRESADERASFESKWWEFDCERTDIAYTGKQQLPTTVVNVHYQE